MSCAGPLRPAERVSWLDAFAYLATRQLSLTPDPSSVGDRCQVVLHVDTDTLAADRGQLGQLEDGPALDPETLRRLACDAAVVAMLRGPRGEVLDVGRRTRRIPPAIARALRVRDKGCRFPGCLRRRALHAHHVWHWALGGPTALSNLVLLCPYHHGLVHEGGHSISVIDGGRDFRFYGPDGRTLDDPLSVRVRPATYPLPDVEPNALTITDWSGYRLDLADAILSLLNVHETNTRKAAA